MFMIRVGSVGSVSMWHMPVDESNQHMTVPLTANNDRVGLVCSKAKSDSYPTERDSPSVCPAKVTGLAPALPHPLSARQCSFHQM